jgi:hypothetical protein
VAKKRIKFSFVPPQGVKEVRLCGDFTSWEQGAIRMRGTKSGEWSTSVSVEEGEHQYKFWADGNWYTDPSAESQYYNNFGTQNSVRRI